MAYHYMAHTLQVHDRLMELKAMLKDYQGWPQIDKWMETVDQMDQNLEHMRFQVAVVGEFKRGKTSLINALLRKRILPADVVPTTATLNRITYGDVPASYLYWKDGRPAEKIEIAQLADYITKLTASSAMQASGIQEAVVTYPCRFCEHNVDLIDTPGMNDDDNMNHVTIQGLSEIDLAMVVLDPFSPVSNTEAHFIAHLVENDQICQIIYVLNKMDTVFEDEQDVVVEAVQKRLKSCVRQALLETHQEGDQVLRKFDTMAADLILFPVSSVQALCAYERDDKEALEHSGFRRLNDELPPLIIRTQHSAAILTPLRRMIRISEEWIKLLERWGKDTDEAAERLNLKVQFAQTAYGEILDLGQVWEDCTNCLTERKKEHVDGVFHTFLELAQGNFEQAYTVDQVKRIFQKLNQTLAQEEWNYYEQVVEHHLLPPYQTLVQRLSQLLQKHPNFMLDLTSKMAKLAQRPKVEEFWTVPEPFYWEKSPMPPPDVRPGQVAYLIESAVRLSLERYYVRRQARLAQLLKTFQREQEQRLEEVVQELFQRVKAANQAVDYCPVCLDERTRLTDCLYELMRRCREEEDTYLSQKERENS